MLPLGRGRAQTGAQDLIPGRRSNTALGGGAGAPRLGCFCSGGTADDTVLQAYQRRGVTWGSGSGVAWNDPALGLRRVTVFEGPRRVGFPFPDPAEDQPLSRMPPALHF